MGCFVRGGKNGMGCYVRGDKNSMGCYVQGYKNSMGCFARGGKSLWDVLSGVAKNGMGCFVPGCFVRLPLQHGILRLFFTAMFAQMFSLLVYLRGQCSSLKQEHLSYLFIDSL